MAYATLNDVQARMNRQLNSEEQATCVTLLDDASVMIDAETKSATEEQKKIVACRMVIRALGSGDSLDVPVGATQGTMSALGYSQSWTMSNGSAGELYISKSERRLLGVSNSIGSRSPLEHFVEEL